MNDTGTGSGGKLLLVVLVLALGGLLIVIGVQSRSNRETVADLEARIEEQAETTAELREKTRGLAGDLDERKYDLRMRDESIDGLTRRAEELDARVVELEAGLAAARKERDEHHGARLELARRLEATETALALEGRTRRESAERTGERLATLEALLARVEQERDSIAAERTEALRRIAGAESTLREREEAVERLKSELGDALERALDLRRDLEAARAAREEMARRLREVLAKLHEKEIPEGADVTR